MVRLYFIPFLVLLYIFFTLSHYHRTRLRVSFIIVSESYLLLIYYYCRIFNYNNLAIILWYKRCSPSVLATRNTITLKPS